MTKKLVLIFIFSFVLNLVWENLHSVLYYHPNGEIIDQLMLLRATLFDAIFITLLSIPFLKIPFLKKHLYLTIIVSLLVAVFIELRALEAGRWAYTEAMPIIPILNTGLTPTIQLGFLAYVVYKLVGMGDRNKANLTCPHCGYIQEVEIPQTGCLAFHQCLECKKIISVPKDSSNCCVICEYSDKACPVGRK